MSKTKNFIRAVALVLALGTITAGCRSKPASSDTDSSYSSFVSDYQSSESGSSSETESTDSAVSSQQQTSNQSKGQSGQTNKNTTTPGQSTETQTEKPVTTPNNQNNQTGATANDTVLCAYNAIAFDKSVLLPSVAYMVDGEIKDTMFDSFGFTITSDAMYNYNEVDALKPLTKTDHLRWINTEMQSVKALNSATQEVKDALGRPSYKVGVILSIVPLSTQVTSYGVVDGKDLNLTVMEDRKKAVKWFIDEKISQFNSGNYANLELKGFYWVSEGISQDNALELIQYGTSYVRTKGLKTFWAPFFCAPGWNQWQTAGFDVTALQANYFPPETNLPNSGEGRLEETIKFTREYNMGVELEMVTVTENCVTYYKRYLKTYVDTEILNKYHAYYIQAGPSSIKQLSQSKDSYIRSAYDDTYKFIKKTLKSSEIIIR